MAAPVSAFKFGYAFRDAKGQVGKMTVIIGDATNSAVLVDATTLFTALSAVSNANVRETISPDSVITYGGAGQFQSVEDKMQLVFQGPTGRIHRYQVPAPKASGFLADLETVNSADTNVASLLTAFTTFVYGRDTDTAPLVYVGGIRLRRRFIRRFNIITKNPAETGPGE